ncbi:cell wall-active antibiotics response protein LiaF [Paenibacillus bouchesdurhonensis]|uniref:cell wall-active antibiotics response protein LiaF n=1 Tax=Paenibacillus bouchesdurhonensis TaxID=1870990 RepID=UPI000DA633A4|nr:cell wall-active antibiotics response protein LiaF [Paenibacillus bouchesdurhonensis]
MKNGMSGRIIGGFVLIAIGVVFLLNQLGFTDISIGYLFSTYWPVFMILAGILTLVNRERGDSNFIWSLVLIALGLFFLGKNLGYLHISPSDFFKMFIPVMLIIAGLSILFKPRDRSRNKEELPRTPPPPVDNPFEAPIDPAFHPEMESPLDKIFGTTTKTGADQEEKQYGDNMNYGKFQQGTNTGKREVLTKAGFIGDVHLGQDYFQLQPMNISHFIGDTIIDLTKAQIPYGETKITVSAFIGDVKVFIPEDMDIGITATSSALIGDLKVLSQKRGGFLSNVNAQSPHYGEAGKRIKLVVSVFVGDVKVNMVG